MSKRISKEELQSDPLIDNYNRAAAYLAENKPMILSIVIGFVVIIGALIGYNYYSSVQEEEAQALLAIAENQYNIGDFEKALYGDQFALTYGFQHIATDYSGTNAGNLASFYAAVCSYNLGDIEEALSYISRFDVPKGIMGVPVITFHAKLLHSNGNLDAAARKYVEAANWNLNNATTPHNLLKAAQVYYEAGDYNRAEQLTTQIIAEYPESTELTETQKLQGKLLVVASK